MTGILRSRKKQAISRRTEGGVATMTPFAPLRRTCSRLVVTGTSFLTWAGTVDGSRLHMAAREQLRSPFTVR